MNIFVRICLAALLVILAFYWVINAHAAEPNERAAITLAVDEPIIVNGMQRFRVRRPELMVRTINRIRCEGNAVPKIHRFGSRIIIVRC